MRILLRHSGTRLFLGGARKWVKDVESALDFETIDRAQQQARAEPLHQIEIVLSYDSPRCDLTLPLHTDYDPSASS